MARRPAPLFVPLALAAALAAPVAARADDDASPDERYSLRAELGPELDTNAHRTEDINVAGVQNPAAIISPLARGVLTASLSDVIAEHHQIALSATLAAKLFANSAARDEDVGIAESTLIWRAALAPRISLAIAGAYYEAFQRAASAPTYSQDRRDFRSITPSLRLAFRVGDHAEVGFAGGSRVFVFKPDHSFDFQAPTAAVDLRWGRETNDGAADWEAGVRAAYERRAFESLALVQPTPCPSGPTCPPTSGTEMRVDDFLITGFDVARTGRVLVGGGYALHLNRSNSFGESVMRHFLTARFAALLPFDVYLAARVEVLFARYVDKVVVAETDVAAAGRTFVSIEDENRNNARVDLSRNLGERLQLLARYTFYANELGTGDVTYRRHTALMFLAFTFEK